MTTEFPAVFKVIGGDTSQAERQTLAGIDRITASGKRKLTEFSREAQILLDQALSVNRNDAGALDLGVAEIQRATAAQQQRAVASREVADAAARVAAAEGFRNQEMRESVVALRQLQQAEEAELSTLRAKATALEAVQRELNQTKSATDLVTQATRAGTTARGNVINSVRAAHGVHPTRPTTSGRDGPSADGHRRLSDLRPAGTAGRVRAYRAGE